jgi:Flp pilus assembly protein CpaB
MFRALRYRLPRIGRGPRLAAAAACLLFAISSATSSARGNRPAARAGPVVVAAADLPAGHRLSTRDLTVVQWPARLRPAGSSAAAARLIGRRLAGRISAREAVTASRLIGADLAAGLGADAVAAAVSSDDPHVVDLVRPGDRIDVLETPRPLDTPDATTADPPPVTTVTQRVRVLAVLPADAETDAEIVVAVTRAIAVRLARDRSTQVFTIAVDPP